MSKMDMAKEIEDLKAENKRLKKYTRHKLTCNIESKTYIWEKGCTCGLEQALKGE